MGNHHSRPGVTILYGTDVINATVQKLATQISHDYKDKKLVLVGVLKGAASFMNDLSRAITIPHEWRFITAKSYIGTQSSGKVLVSDNKLDVEGKDILFVEDIIDTGLTLKTLVEHVKVRENAATIECCALLDKISKREHTVNVKYIGIPIEDKFVVGYGLDYDGYGRNLRTTSE